jgi:hypothetical protein
MELENYARDNVSLDEKPNEFLILFKFWLTYFSLS